MIQPKDALRVILEDRNTELWNKYGLSLPRHDPPRSILTGDNFVAHNLVALYLRDHPEEVEGFLYFEILSKAEDIAYERLPSYYKIQVDEHRMKTRTPRGERED